MGLSSETIAHPPILYKKRMKLVPVNTRHRPLVMQYLSDRAVRDDMKLVTLDTFEKQEEWWQRFKDWRKKLKALQWCGFDREKNDYICLLTLKEIDLSNRRAEIGYSVMKQFWGRGYGTEGASAMVKYAFEELDFHTLFALILTSNLGSQRIIESLEFMLEGELKESHYFRGAYYDVLQYGRRNPHHLRT